MAQMDLDVVLDEIGQFGRYQKLNYLLLCLPVFFCAANVLSYVFLASTQRHRCFVPGCDTIENPQYVQSWLQNQIPGKISLIEEKFVAEQCLKFERSTNESCSISSEDHEVEECQNWVYDDSGRTIVQDYELTCHKNEWKLAFIGSIHFAGVVAGSTWLMLGDYFGRKMILVTANIFMTITGILKAFAPTFTTFAFLEFLNSFGASGVYPLAFVLGVEMVGKSKRGLAGIAFNYFFAFGEAGMGAIAWWTKDWRKLQLYISIPSIIFVSYYWIIPESVRWLLLHNKNDAAIETIRKVAKTNKKELSPATLESFKKVTATKEQVDKSEVASTFKKLFTNNVMLFRTLLTCYIWAVNSLVYYGLSMFSTNLSGNKYLNFIFVSLVEIPGISIAWYTMDKFGRRASLVGSMCFCGLTCLMCAFTKSTWLLVTLFLLGKMGITCSYAVVYVHSAEMMPTLIRSGIVGVFSTTARCAALLAPYVPLLKNLYEPLPLLVFGMLPIICGLLALTLPETLNKSLPDTIEEAIKMKYEQKDDGEPAAEPLN